MIELQVADYCHACPEFEADVQLPRLYPDGEFDDVVIGDTIIRCKHRTRCYSIHARIRREMESKNNDT